jgi:hypothetical protein
MGTKAMEEALERVKQWTLANVLPRLKQPFVILHGENDLAITLEDARKAFGVAGSTDKRLRNFTLAQDGAEHVQADQPDQARQLIADGFAQRPAKVQLRIVRTARLSRVVSGYNPCVAPEMFKGARQEMCEAAKTRRR